MNSESKADPSQDTQTKPKVADRPHWITVAATLFTSLGTVVALYLTTQSINLNERGMKIGQRAYLVVRNGTGSVGAGPDPNNLCKKSLATAFEIHNLGNTPAALESVTISASVGAGVETRFSLTPNGVEHGLRGHYVPQKDKESVTLRDDIYFTAEAEQTWRTPRTEEPPAFGSDGHQPLKGFATLIYKDVFDEPHEISWTWNAYDASPMTTDAQRLSPERCKSEVTEMIDSNHRFREYMDSKKSAPASESPPRQGPQK